MPDNTAICHILYKITQGRNDRKVVPVLIYVHKPPPLLQGTGSHDTIILSFGGNPDFFKGGFGLNDSKFTVHSFMLVFTIFAAIILFFFVGVVEMADRRALNDFYPIEGTDLAVRYSSKIDSGLYRGDKNTGVLLVKGQFGFDWGAAIEGDKLYLNEYERSDLGFLFSRVVCIDLTNLEKTVLYEDAILRGRCASGELVCLGGYLSPSSFPKSNPFCRLYGIASPETRPDNDSALVLYFDPQSTKLLYCTRDDEALRGDFEQRYLAHTLAEVRG